jgi:CheY-like chemotaxis protein
MRAVIAETGDAEAALSALSGWRRDLLRDAYLTYCGRSAPSLGAIPLSGFGSAEDTPLPVSAEFRDKLSHDLRNPLSTIASAIALLKRDDHPAGTARWLSVIERQLGSMVKLVDEQLTTEERATIPPPPPAPQGFTRQGDSTPPPRPGLRVLIVDDNQDAATTLAELVTAWGHSVEVAYDGARALALGLEDRFDVIVLDIELPGMNGFEIAERLRETRIASKLIALTGYGQKGDKVRAKALGFTAHMMKPVDASLLKTAINAHASQS